MRIGLCYSEICRRTCSIHVLHVLAIVHKYFCLDTSFRSRCMLGVACHLCLTPTSSQYGRLAVAGGVTVATKHEPVARRRACSLHPVHPTEFPANQTLDDREFLRSTPVRQLCGDFRRVEHGRCRGRRVPADVARRRLAQRRPVGVPAQVGVVCARRLRGEALLGALPGPVPRQQDGV